MQLRDRSDGALLVGLTIPRPVREAWQHVVDLAGNGPLAFPVYRGSPTETEIGGDPGLTSSVD